MTLRSKRATPRTARRAAGLRALLPALGLAVLLPTPSRATLGGDAASVQADGTAMRAAAAVQVTPREGFAVHEMTSDRGTTVREFVSPAGVVYGVAWQGPFMPDLRRLLGAHFATFTGSTHRLQAGHAHLTVTEPGLVVESTGHLRAFRGRAYLPDAVPAGVSIDTIR
ncbi:MAG TPA: DUF2844 domain-containing protein [Burkholderiaceae bacterium]|nr:DUF2844 domain-containing protein [Burkholderiaceae bacterium]